MSPSCIARARTSGRSCCSAPDRIVRAAMQLNLERPDYTWYLRGADGRHALVNERELTASFVIAPEALVEDWPVTDAKAMTPGDLAPLLALQPELIVLGTGPRQVFPPAAVLHACLSQGIGL